MSYFTGEMDKAIGIPVSELDIRLDRLGDLSFHNDFQPLLKMQRDVASQILGLSGAALEQALNRRFSLLYRYTGSKSKIPFWHNALSKVGLNLSQGGRVFALSGPHNKATPIHWFSKKLISMQQTAPKIIAIGDSNNDKPMLMAAAIACVIPRLNGSSLALPEHPSVVFAEEPAPFGWQDAAKKALEML
jgi:mannosyl-3-phosphoglycerate phosphatase